MCIIVESDCDVSVDAVTKYNSLAKRAQSNMYDANSGFPASLAPAHRSSIITSYAPYHISILFRYRHLRHNIKCAKLRKYTQCDLQGKSFHSGGFIYNPENQLERKNNICV